MNREPSLNAFLLIKAYEGCRLKAYLDTGDVPTIGFGHTAGVKLGQTITKNQAEQFLWEDMHIASDYVNQLISYPINQNQHDALTSFIFNLGPTQFSASTLRRTINKGLLAEAPIQFKRWVYDNGVKLNGLIKRREAEAKLFSS